MTDFISFLVRLAGMGSGYVAMSLLAEIYLTGQISSRTGTQTALWGAGAAAFLFFISFGLIVGGMRK